MWVEAFCAFYTQEWKALMEDQKFYNNWNINLRHAKTIWFSVDGSNVQKQDNFRLTDPPVFMMFVFSVLRFMEFVKLDKFI